MQNCNSKLQINIKLRAYKFSLAIIRFLSHLSKNQTNQIISNQLLRSATSIGANIIEAQAASSRRDFKNFMNHSLKSANETKYWLCLLRDSNIAPTEQIETILQEAIELSKILGSSMLKLKGRR
ncbi:MAG: four helix bundle protein [Candidatus Portnoybacteria bacterium CG23_combo_of_CG06-09_8_20_14_all_37_13]|uniref:Four helix bundle protein n=1 Tax=Candidatus Portnoybacteria bacterium CG23_combo_of_CG06-09_8_20_14_all_37_13 TaxID=1974819 RepID=A0A2G9YEG8_9BACT|nr:MAG: four helix bundle protein [Candidatus Portnoybacteria bacterium CG23_combo_of_CG06-09_8_20_14_all_37_13]